VVAEYPLTKFVRTLTCASLTFAILTCCPGALAQAQDKDTPAKPDAQKADAQKPDAPAAPPAPRAHEDTRTRYPAFLADSYFGVHIAYLNYNFSDRQLEPGFHASTLAIPRLGARVDLLGHRFNQFFSVHGTYMRPVAYVTYRDVNGDGSPHHVWTNFGAVMAQGQVPVNDSLSVYAEAGLGIVSRRGFDVGGTSVIRHAHFKSPVLGTGLIYHVDSAWDVVAGVTYIPSRAEDKEPAAVFASTGFRYNMRPQPVERGTVSGSSEYIFPENVVQLEFATGRGYSVNTFLSNKARIFWGGNVEIDRGLALHYERNVFHTRKFFALDLGTSVSYWRSRLERDKFVTLSVYPLLRFTLLRTKPADLYVMYSLAGPTYITKIVIDSLGTGGNFTFQDFVGGGVFIGEKRNVSLGIKVSHYSNGNLFIDNAALKIPVTINLGYAF
jgi:opacity protein-like surface antigen